MAEYIVNPEEERLLYGDKYEQLIRCKDCRRHKDEEPGMVYCPIMIIIGGWIDEDGYCSWAERRGNDR